MRSTLLEVMAQDYVRTARAKGLRERSVIWRHGLRNALIPVITVIGLQFGALLGGAVITEAVFAWPGVGSLSVQALFNRDYPIVQTTVMLLAVVFALINLAVDISYGFLDPRIRYS
jgi:peptide/nickel transport system permease protein